MVLYGYWYGFNADEVKLYDESVRQKMAKICVHELSSFAPPNLERYLLMGRDDNSLDEIEVEEKTIGYVTEKYKLIKKGYSRIQKNLTESTKLFLRQYLVEDVVGVEKLC